MGDYQYPFAAVVQAGRIEHTAEPKNDIAPALAGRRPEVELAEQGARCGMLGKTLLNSETRKPVEDAELLFPEPLVDHES
jgi:hypothetical protein